MKKQVLKYDGLVAILQIILAIAIPDNAWASAVSNYRNESMLVTHQKIDYVVMRAFSEDGRDKFLVINPFTFATKIIDAKDSKKCEPNKAATSIAKTLYGKALQRFTKPPYVSENYGLKTARSSAHGVYLTVDMCPSSKAFEKAFFESLIAQGKKHKRMPVAVAISLTGRWALNHALEFDWLIKQHQEKNLDITWINHSYLHLFPRKSKIQHAAFVDEVLLLEKMLIEKGQMPSVFFRFPALRSDEASIIKLRELGLIPVASDAWLAKGQKAKERSIILVHGNANEPAGISLATRYLTANKKIKLLPISDALFAAKDKKIKAPINICTSSLKAR